MAFASAGALVGIEAAAVVAYRKADPVRMCFAYYMDVLRPAVRDCVRHKLADDVEKGVRRRVAEKGADGRQMSESRTQTPVAETTLPS